MFFFFGLALFEEHEQDLCLQRSKLMNNFRIRSTTARAENASSHCAELAG